MSHKVRTDLGPDVCKLNADTKIYAFLIIYLNLGQVRSNEGQISLTGHGSSENQNWRSADEGR